MSRHHRLLSMRAMLAPAIVLLLVLSGCASNATGHARTGTTATTSSTSGSSATSTSTTVSSSPQPPAACGSSGGSSLTIQKLQLGRYGTASRNIWEQLPDSLALKPQVISQVTPVATGTVGAAVDIDVSVSQPPASQPGYVCGATVRIIAFQPLAGSASNVYVPCVDQTYLIPGGYEPSTACPAGPVAAGSGMVRLPSSAVGAQATGEITIIPFGDITPTPNRPAQEPPYWQSSGGSPYPSDLLLNVQVPEPGTYTFAVSLWQDSSGPSVTGPNVTAMFLFGQAQHEWGGQPCTQPAMQAQLPPATNPPTQVICPGGAPTVQ